MPLLALYGTKGNLNFYADIMKPIVKQTDAIVSRFTRDILDLARKNGVEFAYAGKKKDAPKEINKVMQINTKTVKELVK